MADLIASKDAAPQHGPRPLPLFLSILWRETENDPELRRLALAGLRRFQHTKRRIFKRPPPSFVADDRALMLHLNIDAARSKTPVVLIPSLVNPPTILDLSPEMSLGGWLTRQGHDVWLVDWGAPRAEDAGMNLAQHVERLLLPLIAQLERPPILVGYCLGGTLAMAAAQLCDAKALAVMAAPWDFSRYPETNRSEILELWTQHHNVCEQLGYLPMEVLQSGFWNLDPARTIRKFAAFAQMEEVSGEADAFVAVEDWANEGEPLTFAAAQELFEQLYRNNTTAEERWVVGGEVIRPATLRCPTFSIRSATDRIVPADASPILKENMEIPLGHVGMIIGRNAPEQLWQPLSDWLARQEER